MADSGDAGHVHEAEAVTDTLKDVKAFFQEKEKAKVLWAKREHGRPPVQKLRRCQRV